MKCPACKKEIPEGAEHCPHCMGEKSASRESPPTMDASKYPLSGAGSPSGGEHFGDRYVIQEKLGAGGFATVFKAFDEKLGEPVALKFIKIEKSSDPGLIKRLKREFRITRRISHPNVVRTHDLQETKGLLYISMELIEGRNLLSLIREQGPLPIKRCMEISRQVCLALGAAHRSGVIHRDLKPANILLNDEGTVKILDFGISKARDLGTVSSEGHLLGTPEYMSPEQVETRPLDARSDLYALGVILYEMLTSFPPFRGSSPLSTALMHTKREARSPRELNPLIPPWLESLIFRLLEKDPARRFASAEEVIAALDKGEAFQDTRETRDFDAPDRIKRSPRKVLAIAGAVLITFLIAFAAFMIFHRGEGGGKGVLDDGIVHAAVCEFQSLQGDAQGESYCDALEESIQAQIAGIQSVRVKSRLAFAELSGRQSDLLARAPNLGIEHIIAGKANRFGTDLRVDIQVIDVSTKSIFMAFSKRISWIESLEHIDPVAADFKSAYEENLKALKKEKTKA